MFHRFEIDFVTIGHTVSHFCYSTDKLAATNLFLRGFHFYTQLVTLSCHDGPRISGPSDPPSTQALRYCVPFNYPWAKRGTTRILNLEQFLSQNKMRIYMIQIIRRLTSKQGCFYYKILHILLVSDTSVT